MNRPWYALALVALVGCLVTASLSTAQAPPAPAKGTVSGRILDANGAPIPNAMVFILGDLLTRERPPSGGGMAPAPKSILGIPAPDEFQLKGRSRKGTATTDASGAFLVKACEPGDWDYVVMVNREMRAKGKVSVRAGQDSALGDLKVSPTAIQN